MKKTDLPKLPKGLSWRKYASGNLGIQISFTYNGVPCREVIPNVTNTKSDINYVTNLIGEIRARIVRDTFVYADYFPNSSKLEIFGGKKSTATLEHYIDQHIVAQKNKGLSEYTLVKKEKYKQRLKDKWQTKVIDIDTKWLKEYFLGEKVSFETCKITLGVISGALDEAVVDKVIPINPCVGFKLKSYVNNENKVYNTTDKADPFVLEECLSILEGVHSLKNQFGELTQSIENFIQLWFNTGLRTQEIFGLKWENIDLKEKQLHVKIGVVRGKEKDTLKTAKAKRVIPLNEAAMEALKSEMPNTFFQKGFVFIDEKNNIFSNDEKFRRRVWEKVLKAANVRYRRPYNCRHTFATMHISSKNYVNEWELIQWLGHSNMMMLQKHYADFKKTYELIDSTKGISQNCNITIARAKRV
ncbi:site-specific integrase [Vibrio owensii]|uniref:site-specific integrase n=1 Tax=Vibrio owensii TaxID=696485 RepID=UPI0038CEF76D